MLALGRRPNICLEAALEKIKLMISNMWTGEFPHELSKVLPTYLTQQLVRKIIELHTWVIKVERHDAMFRKLLLL